MSKRSDGGGGGRGGGGGGLEKLAGRVSRRAADDLSVADEI